MRTHRVYSSITIQFMSRTQAVSQIYLKTNFHTTPLQSCKALRHHLWRTKDLKVLSPWQRNNTPKGTSLFPLMKKSNHNFISRWIWARNTQNTKGLFVSLISWRKSDSNGTSLFVNLFQLPPNFFSIDRVFSENMHYSAPEV